MNNQGTAEEHARQLRQHQVAIKPDGHSKAAYAGRVTQTEHVTIFAEDGTAYEKDVIFIISWDSISKILDLIGQRAEG